VVTTNPGRELVNIRWERERAPKVCAFCGATFQGTKRALYCPAPATCRQRAHYRAGKKQVE